MFVTRATITRGTRQMHCIVSSLPPHSSNGGLLNCCCLSQEIGLLMTWIEPVKEKMISFETLDAKLSVLLEVRQALRIPSPLARRSLVLTRLRCP